MDKTQNYGSAFYSCAVGMGLGAFFLALVGPAKSGLCHRGKRKQEEQKKGGEDEEKLSQDSGTADFMEIELVQQTSPAKQTPQQETSGF